MAKKKKQIEVLSALRPMLKLTNLYNKNGVHLKYNKNPFKIPDSYVICLISLPAVYLASLYLWFVLDEKFNLKTISTSLGFAIGLLQMTLAYISLALKTDLIISTIDHLQEFTGKCK